MITIKNIAFEANVSKGTVDRVLHNRGGVSKKTEKKIKGILEKYNFKVNPVARALKMKNKFQLATLIPNYDSDNLFWKSPYLGILKASDEVRNFGVEVENYTFNQFDPNSYLSQFNVLLNSNPSAVVLVPTFKKETKQIIDQLERLKIPYLFFNIDLNGFKNICFVGQDSFTAGYLAGKLMHLEIPKQTTILIIQSRTNISNYHSIYKRIEGFNNYFIKNNVNTTTLTLSIDNHNDINNTQLKINSFLKQHNEIKGIFIPSSRISNIVKCINKPSLNKLKMIGFDNTQQNIECLKNDEISFLISQKPFDQGYESVHLMTDYLVENKIPKNVIFSPIEILTKENVSYSERNKLQFENENSNF